MTARTSRYFYAAGARRRMTSPSSSPTRCSASPKWRSTRTRRIIEAQQKVIDLDPTRQMMSLSFDAGPNLFRGIVQQLVEGEIRDPEPIPARPLRWTLPPRKATETLRHIQRSAPMADNVNTSTKRAAVTPVGLNHLVLNVRNMEESHRFWTETVGFKQVGELHATPKRPNPPKMRFYSGDHGGGAMSHHDIALIENPNLPAPPAEWSMTRHAVRDQPHRHRLAEPRGVAEAARLSAGAWREVRPPRRARHDPQPVHPRSERLRRRAAVRAAARGLGRRHRRRAELRRAVADRRARGAGGPHGRRAGVQAQPVTA